MAGPAGAVDDLVLPKTGIDVAFATERIYHVNGTPRQDWVPPVPVDGATSNGSDSIPARGLEELKGMMAGKK
jgi:hypothetical protein